MITFANMNMYASIAKVNAKKTLGELVKTRGRSWTFMDIMIKVIGLIIAATVYPPAMLYSVLVTLLLLVIPNQIKHEQEERRR